LQGLDASWWMAARDFKLPQQLCDDEENRNSKGKRKVALDA
jgi:hypothetical protein